MHWIYPSIGGAFFAFGLGANGDMTFTFIIDTYREVCTALVHLVHLVTNTNCTSSLQKPL